MIDRPAGTVKAAAAPFAKRNAISARSLLINELTTEAMPKTATATRKTLRRPSRSDARPPSSSRPPYPSTYPLTIHCSELADRCRSEPIDGRATPTMETSSPSRNRAPQSTTSKSQTARVQPVVRVTLSGAAAASPDRRTVLEEEIMVQYCMHVHRMHKHILQKHQMQLHVLTCATCPEKRLTG